MFHHILVFFNFLIAATHIDRTRYLLILRISIISVFDPTAWLIKLEKYVRSRNTQKNETAWLYD